MDPFCYLYFMFVFYMMSFLFLAALWSPAGKGLTSWHFCDVFVLLSLSHMVPQGQVWYLIVLISDLCLLLYFVQYMVSNV